MSGRAPGERRGIRWMVGAFVACPCHLPLTLAAVSAVLGGTAAGALLRAHVVLAGVLITTVWLLGTARGVWLLRRPQTCVIPRNVGTTASFGSEETVQAGPTGTQVRRVTVREDTLYP